MTKSQLGTIKEMEESESGRLIIFRDADGGEEVFDAIESDNIQVSYPNKQQRINNNSYHINAFSFSMKRKFLISRNNSVINESTGKKIYSTDLEFIHVDNDEFQSRNIYNQGLYLVFSNNEKFLFILERNKIEILEGYTGQSIKTFSYNQDFKISFSNNDSLLAIASDSSILVYDLVKKSQHSFPISKNGNNNFALGSIRFNKNSSQLLGILTVNRNENKLITWDVKTGRELKTNVEGRSFREFAFPKAVGAKPLHSLILERDNGNISVFNSENGMQLSQLDNSGLFDIVNSELLDHGILILEKISDRHQSGIWDCNTGKLISSNIFIRDRSFKSAFLLCQDKDTFKVFSTKSGAFLKLRFTKTRIVNRMFDVDEKYYFSEDEKYFVMIGTNPGLKIWSLPSEKLIFRRPGKLEMEEENKRINHGIESPLTYAGGSSSTISGDTIIFKITSSKFKGIYKKLKDYNFTEASFSPGSKKLLLCDPRRGLFTFDFATTKFENPLKDNSIIAARYIADGKMILANRGKYFTTYESQTFKIIYAGGSEGSNGFTKNYSDSTQLNGLFSKVYDMVLKNSKEKGDSVNIRNALLTNQGKVNNDLKHFDNVMRSLSGEDTTRPIVASRNFEFKITNAKFSSNGIYLLLEYDIHSEGTFVKGFPGNFGYMIINLGTGKLLDTRPSENSTIQYAELNHDGTRIALLLDEPNSRSRTLQVINCSDGSMAYSIKRTITTRLVHFSADDNFIISQDNYASSSDHLKLQVFNANNGTAVGIQRKIITGYGFDYPEDAKYEVCSNGKTAVVYNNKDFIISDLTSDTDIIRRRIMNGTFGFNADRSKLILTSDSSFAWDCNSNQRIETREFPTIKLVPHENQYYFQKSNTEKNISYMHGGRSNLLQVKNYKEPLKSREFTVDGNVSDIDERFGYFISANKGGSLLFYSLNTGEQMAALSLTSSFDFVMQNKAGEYLATPGAVEMIKVDNGTLLHYKEFDATLNKPSQILKDLGSRNPIAIRQYEEADRLRVKNVISDKAESKLQLEILNKLSSTIVANPKFDLELEVSGLNNQIEEKNCKVKVNGTPLECGNKVQPMDSKITLPLILNEGKNNIEALVIDHNGTKSNGERIVVTYEPAIEEIKKCYFVGIGVRRYKNTYKGQDMNLTFADRDVVDFAAAIKDIYGANAVIDTLLNESVTNENIIRMKEKIAGCKEDDIVIMLVSGHGISVFDSTSKEFYFAPSNMNFNRPMEYGIKYDEIESIISCTKSRKKLILIDACNSGKEDTSRIYLLKKANQNRDFKEKNITIENVSVEERNELIGIKGPPYDPGDTIDHSGFELMTDYYLDLSEGNGITVLAAATGYQSAYEGYYWEGSDSTRIENGLFTYCLLKEGLQKKRADGIAGKVQDGHVTLSELKKFVEKEIWLKSNPEFRQKAICNKTNLDYDWVIW